MLYKNLIRPFLFRFDAESVHHFSFGTIKKAMTLPGARGIAKSVFKHHPPQLAKEVFGLKFPSPVGLAAGFDKDAQLIDELAAFGFGFIEIGTLTPKAQAGNPKPRLFRLKPDQGLINRLGFNNKGLEAAIQNLKQRKSSILVGGNIGKNKVTPNEDATSDYEKGFEALFPFVDYFTVNVSSPNTPNLRDLQEKEPLKKLLLSLQNLNREKPKPKPILLKIAPDLTDSQLDDILEIVSETKIDGVIATNTTISRDNLATNKEAVAAIGAGGVSGKPLAKRSTEVIRYLYEKSGRKLPIIGVGGIMSVEDAKEKLEAGACLLQLYTGFVYEGPSLVKQINKALAEKN